MQARELKPSKQVPFSLSQHFPGRIGEPVRVTSCNLTGSAVHLHLAKAWFLQNGLTKVDMF